MVFDEVVKSQKGVTIVIPAPIFIGINSSRNPVISNNDENAGGLF